MCDIASELAARASHAFSSYLLLSKDCARLCDSSTAHESSKISQSLFILGPREKKKRICCGALPQVEYKLVDRVARGASWLHAWPEQQILTL